MEMPSGLNRKVGWPCHQVAGSPLDWHGAVWADPSLSSVLRLAVGWLNETWNTVFLLGALHAHSNEVQVELFRLLTPSLPAARPVAPTHS